MFVIQSITRGTASAPCATIVSRSLLVSVVCNALSNMSLWLAASQQVFFVQRYAPRPACLPVISMITPSSFVRTTRVRSRLACFSRHTIQVRCGICLCFVADCLTIQSTQQISEELVDEVFPVVTRTTRFTPTMRNNPTTVLIEDQLTASLLTITSLRFILIVKVEFLNTVLF